MDSIANRVNKLKERFPAGEPHVLEYAARAPTLSDAINYLREIYGNPTSQPSAWAKPLKVSTAPTDPRERARARALESTTEEDSKPEFDVSEYKIKECRNRAGCNCDNYHHEFERRRNPNKTHYSEIPCPNVFNGSWRAPVLCSKGNNCGHSHTVNEASYHPRTYKTKRCLKFDEGTCHYGIKCAYIHGNNDPIAAAWKRKMEMISQPKTSQPVSFAPKVSLASLIQRDEPPPESDLSPSAWTFMPTVKNPVEELNLKMQKRIEELYLKTLCSICYIKEKDTALIPCGHLFCSECLLQTVTAVCPICRRDFRDKLTVFL
ncbi:unnamed protein product [Blepharisma stoltei]|uniref:RING-type E3 ubiquitin transferase n=1 Tax=Blepharisma stoltei TaxID=1481888 RepID=A0AAU9JI58_9CILI|nr:unnamed protein product [Blepharisma stoltei]